MDERNFTPLKLKPLDTTSNFKRIALYLLLLIFVILFVTTVGITLLMKGTLFLSRSSTSPTPSQPPTSNSLLTPPEFDAIPSATNSARLLISGRAPVNQTVSILLNSIQVANYEVKDGHFAGEINLSEGENILSASYTDNNTRTQKSSNPSKISLITTKPKLELTSPKDGEEITGAEVKIEGFTDKEVMININAFPVVVDVEGKFTHNFILKSGLNEIKIIARDVAGNTSEQDLSLNFTPSQ